jgi:hypothetical protein
MGRWTVLLVPLSLCFAPLEHGLPAQSGSGLRPLRSMRIRSTTARAPLGERVSRGAGRVRGTPAPFSKQVSIDGELNHPLWEHVSVGSLGPCEKGVPASAAGALRAVT